MKLNIKETFSVFQNETKILDVLASQRVVVGDTYR